MKKVLIIPDREHLPKDMELVEKYGVGYEYNDFFLPQILDNDEEQQRIIAEYHQQSLPAYTTMHGAFLDVIPFSMDDKIKEISRLRIEQSIQVAKKIGAGAVVFHTNYNPYLNSKNYVEGWIETNVAYWGGVLKAHSDINIYLENMFDANPDVMEVLSEQLCEYPNYGVCLDYAHAFLSHEELQIWAKRLGRFVKHIHINDNDGISDLHLAWGAGKINRMQFYECYEKYMKDATVLVETSAFENKVKSLELLQKEGFLEK